MKANISDVKLVKPVKNSATHVDKWAASLAQILNWFLVRQARLQVKLQVIWQNTELRT